MMNVVYELLLNDGFESTIAAAYLLDMVEEVYAAREALNTGLGR